MELVRRRAEVVMRASEQESEALRANTAEETAARILAEIDSKYYPTAYGDDFCSGVAVGAGLDGRNDNFGGGRTGSVVADIHRRFEITHKAARTAETIAARAETELDRVRGEAEAGLRQQSEASVSLAADAQHAGRQASAAAAAAERVAASEGALQKARAEASRLREELERARRAEAASQATAEKAKAEVGGRIAQLEGNLREAVAKHRRSREQAEAEIEQLRATLERRAEAERAMSARESCSASTEAAARQRQRVETSRHELGVAERAVAEAKEEVESLKAELGRAAEAAVTSKTRQKVAETRVGELEQEFQEAAREHVLFREDVEERLRELKASFEEENVQNGAQVCDCFTLGRLGTPYSQNRSNSSRMELRCVIVFVLQIDWGIFTQNRSNSFTKSTQQQVIRIVSCAMDARHQQKPTGRPVPK